MTAFRDQLRHRLARRAPVLGCSVDFPTTGLALRLCEAGFDLLLLDCEHGGPGIEKLQDLAIAARAGGAASVARPWRRDFGLVRRYLDGGAGGVVWPDLEHPAEIDDLAGACTDAGHPGAILLALVETRAAVERIEAIVAHPRLDGIIIGPGDLAVSFGHPRGAQDEGLAAVHRRILEAAGAAGKAAGGPVFRLGARFLQEAGASLFMHSAAHLLAQGAAAFRAELGQPGHRMR